MDGNVDIPSTDEELSLRIKEAVEQSNASELEALLERHLEETGSACAAQILQHWDEEKSKFVQIVPKEMLNKLEVPITGLEMAVPAE